MAVAALTNSQLDELRKALVAGVPQAAGFTEAAVTTDSSTSEDFCSVWEAAEPILKIVSSVIGFIPGLGTAAGPILNALIGALDAIAKDKCKKAD